MTWFGAQPRSSFPITIDSMEDGNLSEYAGTSGFSVVTDAGEAQDGDNYLNYDGAGYGACTSNSLANLPTGGDTWRCWIKTTAGVSSTSLHIGFYFMIQDHGIDRDEPGYRIRWEPFDQAFYLQANTGSGYGTVASDLAAGAYTAGDWWEVEVFVPNDPASTPIDATLYNTGGAEQASASGTEGTGAYTDGAFGFYSSTGPGAGEDIRWDGARITA